MSGGPARFFWLALGFASLACRTRGTAVEKAASQEAGTSIPPTEALLKLPPHVSFRRRFELTSVRLTIEDLHQSTRLDEVLARRSARLVINGGFFGMGGEPLGLAVSGRKRLSPFSPSMSGGVLLVRDGMAQLEATEDYKATQADFAIQCRPRLVVDSHSNIRSDDGKRAARTALCIRDAGKTLEFDLSDDDGTEGPTLFELARDLANDGCEEALNLDGGPSTGWASDDGGKRTFRAPRGPVRHAIVVTDADR